MIFFFLVFGFLFFYFTLHKAPELQCCWNLGLHDSSHPGHADGQNNGGSWIFSGVVDCPRVSRNNGRMFRSMPCSGRLWDWPTLDPLPKSKMHPLHKMQLWLRRVHWQLPLRLCSGELPGQFWILFGLLLSLRLWNKSKNIFCFCGGLRCCVPVCQRIRPTHRLHRHRNA